MPLYEYRCQQCGHEFEVIQKFSDPLLETCESCGGRLQKLLSSPAIQFKGAGWYITDYSRKSGADSGSSGSESSGENAAAKQASGASNDQASKDPASKDSASKDSASNDSASKDSGTKDPSKETDKGSATPKTKTAAG